MKFSLDKPDDLSATLAATLTLAEWRKVSAALDKCKETYYGPEWRLVEAIHKVIKAAEQVFYADETAPVSLNDQNSRSRE